MSNTKTVKTAEAIFRQIEDLSDRRETWEKGVYKDSNDELYGMLGDAFTLIQKLRASRAQRKALERFLIHAGITVQANTSLELRMLRAIFGAQGRRELGYKRVLEVARAEKPEGQSLSAFIYERGGIEEIRRTPKDGVSAADQARKNQELAEQELANAAPVGSRFKADATLKPAADGTTGYSLALLREDKDGRTAIVWGTGKQSLVNAVLKEAGKAIKERAANVQVVSDNRDATKKRQAVVKANAKKAKVAKAA